eukprot:1167565-Pyramimonas_sp.AAC.1
MSCCGRGPLDRCQAEASSVFSARERRCILAHPRASTHRSSANQQPQWRLWVCLLGLRRVRSVPPHT